jgi:hypothetical protein
MDEDLSRLGDHAYMRKRLIATRRSLLRGEGFCRDQEVTPTSTKIYRDRKTTPTQTQD